MFTLKAEHKFTDTWSLSGLYIYNKTDEPGSTIMRRKSGTSPARTISSDRCAAGRTLR